jgi:outer membrane protein OmpA-like peptidoglycan-associated protein
MSHEKQGMIRSTTDGGVVGDHAAPAPAQLFVGPSTSGEFNTARLRLLPIACFRVDDIRFQFDSSFIPFDPSSDPNKTDPKDIRAEMRQLQALVTENPGAPLSIFGHADPVGNDDYNKVLSGRRAQAVYAMLIRDIGLWENLFSAPKTIAGDNWGDAALQTMENATGLSPGTPHSILFKAYMDKLCGKDFKLQKSAFLARGADPHGKGDFQGCGEFNPVLTFSQEKQDRFDQAAQKKDKDLLEQRNAANAPNRRVMVLIFRTGSRVDPAKWPCPRASEGVAGCIKRFFSDGKKRRNTHLPGQDRVFEDTQDTFACRFYQRISDQSPCESLGRARIRLLLDDPFLGFLGGISVKVTYATGATETVVADSGGAIRLLIDEGAFADIEFTTSITTHAHRIFILVDSLSGTAGQWQRLVNLGYIDDPQPAPEPPDGMSLAVAVAEFQAMHGIEPTGIADSKTQQSIDDSHNSVVAWKDEQRTDLPDDHLKDSASLPKDAVA